MDELQIIMKKRIVTNMKPQVCKVVKNMTYNKCGGVEYKCDIYLPEDKSENADMPIVFLVHGEAPVTGLKDAGQYVSIGELLASNGIAAVAFDHRMICFNSAIEDVIDDIKKIRDFMEINSSLYSVNSSNTGIWSFSSGMPFGLHSGLNYKTDQVSCLVGYYGFGDFSTLIKLIKNEDVPQSDLPQIINNDSVSRPLLIVRSGLDNEILNDSLEKFILQCTNKNMGLEFYNHENGHHAFDIFDDNPESHRIIGNTIRFIVNNMQNRCDAVLQKHV